MWFYFVAHDDLESQNYDGWVHARSSKWKFGEMGMMTMTYCLLWKLVNNRWSSLGLKTKGYL